ncbi:ABC transporter ATP-binding protein [Aerosakkonema sp. BLCC-F183]|uniref:ABC transporter ATP-binding protein n=1 Tax=Aerosakkonema sp. BLCC-F183 TaxID=3342834 RepID=UPI0035B8E901
MERILLEIENLSKRFCRRPELGLCYTASDIWRELRRLPDGGDFLRPGEFWALRNVNLQIKQGEVVGVIGHNGAGKSTLINLVMGILRPTLGRVIHYTDRVVLIDYQAGLNPIQTGRENIYNQLSIHGFSHRQIDNVVDAIIEYSGIREFIDAPVGSYSTGMRLRLCFSIYTQMRPDIFIIDEALGGGDIRFRQKFINYLQEYTAGGGAILLVSHEFYAVQNLCDRCIILDRGEIKQIGSPTEVIHTYQKMMLEKEPKLLATKEPNVALSVNQINPVISKNQSLYDRSDINLELLPDLQIENLEVLAIDGSEPKTLDSIQFCVTCNSQIENSHVRLGLLIGNNEIFPLVAILGGMPETEYVLVKGHNKLCLTIDKFPLLPGQYKVQVILSDKKTERVLFHTGVQDIPFTIEIKGYPDPMLNLVIYSKSFIYLQSNS